MTEDPSKKQKILVGILKLLLAAGLAIAAATSVLGKPLGDGSALFSGWPAVVGLAAILLLLQFLVVFLEDHFKKGSVLTEGNENFVEYFEEWYSDAQTLKLRCNNLRWLEGVDNAKILAQIKVVGEGAEVYFTEQGSQLAPELSAAGVKLIQCASESSVRFSLKTTGADNEAEVIIRSKVSEQNGGRPKKIWVRQVDDDYQCELARQYLDALRDLAESD